MVAKSFQNLEQIGEPFADGSGKMYVNVRAKNGNLRRVRWYDVDEYCRMYPNEDPIAIKRANDPYYKSTKDIFFHDGWLYVFEGNSSSYLEELCMSPYTRYSTVFGWYMLSDTPAYIVEAVSEWFRLHRLSWGDVMDDEEHLKDDAKEIVDIICNGRAARQWH
jgi:hypothetical protein